MIHNADCRDILPKLADNSIDLLCTDPPYGISFMSKDWDKALPDKQIWQECLRVLKNGAFAFVMSIPRADCLSRMIISLEDAGFNISFTPIFWAYASGFPKAQNIGKAMAKRQGAIRQGAGTKGNTFPLDHTYQDYELTPQATALDGSYGGFQPKPAVEVIIVAMKPLSEKTYVDQALKNKRGITWLDDGRIPYESEDLENRKKRDGDSFRVGKYDLKVFGQKIGNTPNTSAQTNHGRFPANLLVSDDVLNDGKILNTHS